LQITQVSIGFSFKYLINLTRSCTIVLL
jgi:hypothetical protein